MLLRYGSCSLVLQHLVFRSLILLKRYFHVLHAIIVYADGRRLLSGEVLVDLPEFGESVQESTCLSEYSQLTRHLIWIQRFAFPVYCSVGNRWHSVLVHLVLISHLNP